MRSTGAIIFLLIYLSVTEFHQALKIPALIIHYTEHRQDGAMGFIDFMAMHYSDDDVKDADYEKDQQLPFKDSHCIQTSISITTPPEKLTTPAIHLVTLAQKRIIPFLPFRTSTFRFSIWQPPKE